MALDLAGNIQVTVAQANAAGAQLYGILVGSKGKRRELKKARFSDFTVLDDCIRMDVPKFAARLPRKTLRRHTDAPFLDARRAGIERYLLAAASDREVVASRGFKSFFRDASRLMQDTESDDESTPEFRGEGHGDSGLFDNELRADLVDDDVALPAKQHDVRGTSDISAKGINDALSGELDAKSTSARSVAESAAARHGELLTSLKAGEAATAQAKAKSEALLRQVGEDADRLRNHDAGLQALLQDFRRRSDEARERGARHAALATRAEAELESANESWAGAKSAVDEARATLKDQQAKGKAAVSDAECAASRAGAALAVATESKDATARFLAELKSRLVSLEEKKAAALRARESHAKAAESAANDAENARQTRDQVAKRAAESAAALAAHSKDAAERLHGLEANIHRARDVAEASAKLRDAGGHRRRLGDEDREAFAAADAASSQAATQAAQAFAAAKAAREEACAADLEHARKLEAAAKEDAADLANRNKLVKEFEERHHPLEQAVQKASAAHAAAGEAAAALQQDLSGVEAILTKLEAQRCECEAKVTESERRIEEARAKALSAEKAAQHELEAEEAVVARKEAEKAACEQALAEAKRLVSQAKEDEELWSGRQPEMPVTSTASLRPKSPAAQGEDETESGSEHAEAQGPVPSVAQLTTSEADLTRERLQLHSNAEMQLRAEASENAAVWEKTKAELQAELHEAELILKRSKEDGKVKVPAGRTTSLTVRVPEGVKNVKWDWTLSNKTVDFVASFWEEGSDPQAPMKLQSLTRHPASNGPVAGEFAPTGPGRLELVFDNSFSVLRSKKIHVRIEPVTLEVRLNEASN
eukprot:TRINITY_DN899_c0_g1_i7.p1 TRINITY_DN899_c0_g1~~TRINITY_DN899_c0_g1_i7.p1  ORF type:complete len:852 (-),score=243.47 TRINITY_DN899_c0_g1_i7:226-2715(-)